MTPEDVGLALAIEDAVPVLLAVAGLVGLRSVFVRRAGSQAAQTTLVGAVLVGLAGVGKVSWKVNAALTGRDAAWLDDLLFWWLALGFAMLAWTAVAALRDRRITAGRAGSGAAVLAATTALGIVVLGDGDVLGPLLLAVLVGATTIFGVAMIRLARDTGDGLAAVLFGLNLVVTFALAGLARVEPQTNALQWTEQLLNTASQAAFLVAVVRLRRATVADGGAVVPEGRPARLATS